MLVEIMKMGKEETVVATSRDVAEEFGKEHRRVLQDIREMGCSEKFRLHHYVQSFYENAQGRKQPEFIMDRDGFMLLVMAYTGEKAMKIKETYIGLFDAMEKALRGKAIEREKGIAVRQSLTKAIQQSSENERMHGHAYSVYTNCIYKALFGKNAKQLREEYGIGPKVELRDRFSSEELAAIQSMERLVSGLVDCGWGYDQVKEFIAQTNAKRLTA